MEVSEFNKELGLIGGEEEEIRIERKIDREEETKREGE